MLSLLKRKSDAPAVSTVPAWHPNFRDFEKLPDIKVVRTAFFINAAAIALLVGLASYFAISEWQLHVLRTQIAARQSEIDRDKKPNDAQVALYRKFQAEETKVKDVESFITSKPIVSEILIRLARTLPENIALNVIELRDAGLVLRLSVRDADKFARTVEASSISVSLAGCAIWSASTVRASWSASRISRRCGARSRHSWSGRRCSAA